MPSIRKAPVDSHGSRRLYMRHRATWEELVGRCRRWIDPVQAEAEHQVPTWKLGRSLGVVEVQGRSGTRELVSNG